MLLRNLLLPVLLVAVVSTSNTSAEPITTGSLVDEMIDMHKLTYFPEPAYKTVQFSSYDRRSTLPQGPDWFSNSDGFGREPIPNFEAVIEKPDQKGVGEYLICDVPGPGALVRTWTAAINGAVSLYLDDSENPVWHGPAYEFFTKPYKTFAEKAGIEDAVLNDTFYQRDAAYCPIPFAKRCRIVWRGNIRKVHFYQVQARLYEANANVTTFKPDDLKKYENNIRQVSAILKSPKQAWKYSSKQSPTPIDVVVPARQMSKQIIELKGPLAVERLTLKVTSRNLDIALRQTVLNIICDDYPWGQVQAPIGDFFGAAPGINPFDSAPFTVNEDGTMTCRYVIPFKRSCKMVVDNYNKDTVHITGSLLAGDYKWDDKKSMHFRARWRVDHDLVGSGEAVQDMPYLIADGTGVYVGSAVMLLNPCSVPTSNGNWWGEGDEKIFVDDDVRPSTFGTGSEDYYNYSWSIPDHFDYPYCGQPRNDGPGCRGFVTNFRWHVLDPLPFKNRIAFYMELFTHTETPGMSYARIGYHYARPGLIDDHAAITREDVRHLQLDEDGWWPVALRGAERSSFYQAEKLLADQTKISIEENGLFSEGRLAVWKPERKGDRLDLQLKIKNEKRCIIHLTPALRKTSGPISIMLDNKPLGFGGRRQAKDGINLYTPHHLLLRNYSSKPVRLTEGEHILTLQYDGEVDADGSTNVGIDLVWLQRR